MGGAEALVSGQGGLISPDSSPLKAYVIPTNEELLIARDTFRALAAVKTPSPEGNLI